MIKEKNTFFELLRNEGKEEGIEKGKKDFIMKALEERFGGLDPTLKIQVEQVRDDKTLTDLFYSSMRAKNIDDFKKVLARQSKGFPG